MWLLAASVARADAVVTACASDIQVGAGINLAQALAAGGFIGFQCPAGSTIQVTGRYALKGDTNIDGGDAVTLDGRGAAGPLLSTGELIVLRHITLRGFASPPRPAVRPGPTVGPDEKPGVGSFGKIRLTSVLSASGNADLDHVTVEGSAFPIEVRGGATVRDSAFVGNRGTALRVDGTARVERTRFTGNGSALEMSAGSVQSCDFTGQTAGAVRVDAPSGPVEIRHSAFTATRGGPALALSQRAGLGGPQTVTVRANVFRDNDGGAGGGAIDLFDIVQEARDRGQLAEVVNVLATLPPAGFVLAYNRFENNRGGRGGAIDADLTHTAGLVSTGDVFISNAANGDGGAVAVTGGRMEISHALFKDNRAGGRGAALAEGPQAQVSVANSLAIGNTGPAGAIAGSALKLINVTLADNASAGLLIQGATARVSNSIVARNRPGDCQGVPAGVFQGKNSVSDTTCPGMQASEAFLDAFYVPAAGSPALHAGDGAVCQAAPVGGVDLVFQGRRDPAGCALGAFESAPVKRLAAGNDRREPHADAADDFSDDEGYRPPPDRQDPPPEPSPSDTLRRLRGVGIDFSVPERDLLEWLANPRFTPYPAIVSVLFRLLESKRLRRPVFLDVIVWNYEHSLGTPSPRSPRAVNLKVLKAAIVEGFNTRNGTAERNFEEIVQ